MAGRSFRNTSQQTRGVVLRTAETLPEALWGWVDHDAAPSFPQTS